MRKNCDIVKDLIPLYIDNVASEESKNLVETHCDTCKECKKFLALSKETIIAKEKNREQMDKVWHCIERNNRKENIIHTVIILSVIVGAILLVFGGKVLLDSMAPTGNNCIEEHFGKEKYSELDEGYSNSDKKELEPLMKEIDKAMNYFGTEKEAKKLFGELSYYSTVDYEDELSADEVKIDVDWDFVTCKLYTDTGYMWIKYTKEVFDKKGKIVQGCADIESRLTLVDFGGGWTVVNVDEAP